MESPRATPEATGIGTELSVCDRKTRRLSPIGTLRGELLGE